MVYKGKYDYLKFERGSFTYQKLPDANKEPANESIINATTFLKHTKKVIF